MVEEQPWDKETAEKYIHQLARSDNLSLTWTGHLRQRMSERKIIEDDIFAVLEDGAVVGEAEKASRGTLYKYKIQARTPNSGGELVCLAVIPSLHELHLKLLTCFRVKK